MAVGKDSAGPSQQVPPPSTASTSRLLLGGGRSVIWPVLLLPPHPLGTFKEDALGVDQESLQNAEPQCDLPGGQLQSGQFCRCFRLALWEGNSSLSVRPPPPPMVKYLSIGGKVGS
ncbi:unnamed protein product [Caretta caretta]